MDFLTDIEKDKLINFNNDEVLVEAVRKVLLASIYENGTLRKGKPSDPLKNGALSLAALASQGKVTNEELGEDLRGLFQGIQLLESGLREIAKLKKEEAEATEDSVNEAL